MKNKDIVVTRKQLRQLEWSGWDTFKGTIRCPVCEEHMRNGHADKCWLREKLK